MISGTVKAGMYFNIMVCSFLPFIILAYMMFKKRQKQIIPMLLAGGLSVLAGPLVIRTLLELVLIQVPEFKTLGKDNYILYSAIMCMIMSGTMLIGLYVFIKILKPGGLTVNRLIVFSTGANLVYAVVFLMMNVLNRLTVINYINGEKSEWLKGSSDSAKKISNNLKEQLLKEDALDYFANGLYQVVVFLIILAIVLLIYKGIHEDKLKVYILIALGASFAEKFGNDLIYKYFGGKFALIFSIPFGIVAYKVIKDAIKENIKMKPDMYDGL